jgi:LAGLIDADG endonuclease
MATCRSKAQCDTPLTRDFCVLVNDQNGPKVSRIVALVKFGHMLENPWMLRYSLNDEDWVREPNSPASYSSDNSTAAENQQERLSISEKKCWFLAGLIEGEGSLCVSIKAHKPSRFGFLIDPEFFIYQHKIRRGLLELACEVFETGKIYPKVGNEDVLVYSIVSRRLLIERVLPFYERYMAFSFKARDYHLFREILMALESKHHLDPHGLVEIVKKAYQMNMVGKQRKRPIGEVIERILRDFTPDANITVGEDKVRAAWRHAG